MAQKIGQFTAKFEIKLPPANKVRLAIAKPLLFVAQWLVGGPITITAVTETRKPETIIMPTHPDLRPPLGVISPKPGTPRANRVWDPTAGRFPMKGAR